MSKKKTKIKNTPSSTQPIFQLALQHHQTNELLQAQALYRKVLQENPRYSDALHLLGVIAYQQGHYQEAVYLIQQAINLNNQVSNYYLNLGNAFKLLGQLEKAIDNFHQALALHPNNISAYNNLGTLFRDQKNFDQAITYYQQALKLEPKYVEGYVNLGTAYREQGQVTEAIACYQHALSLNPRHLGAYYQLGIAWQEQAHLAEAITCYQTILSLDPQYVRAYNELGRILQKQKQYSEALAYYQQALHLSPQSAEIHYNLGNLLDEQEQFSEAQEHYQQALRFQPNWVEAYYNLGGIFSKQANLNQAIACYQQVLTLHPNQVDAHNNLAEALKNLGRIEEAIQHYRRALELRPNYPLVHSNLLLALNYLENLERATLFAEHQLFNQQYSRVGLSPRNEHRRGRKIKIGYLSPDLRRHPVAYFIEPILAHHNHQQFEIFCYYTHKQSDEVTSRLQRYSDHWLNAVEFTEEALAEQIRCDQIDILVDLAGHTAGNRLLVLARRPAPVQVTYLGYPNTTGLTAIDYRITDDYVDPPKVSEPFNSETLVRMPGSYFCYAPPVEAPPVNPLPMLTTSYFTFGSLNGYHKLNFKLFSRWAAILKAVPNSKLLIKTKVIADISQLLQEQFAKLGIAPERLILEGATPYPLYLTTYHRIDLALDSYPFTGGLTTCEALWMGVPVVTLVGERPASRQGLSLLSTLGLTNLITYTPEEYFEQCVKLSYQPEYLTELRSQMRERMQAAMAAASFTHDLEALYQLIIS